MAPLLAGLLVLSTAGPAAAVDTEFTSGPPSGAVLLPGPVTYGFTANEGGYSFECSVDTGAFAACQSPVTYDLPPGPHVLRVRYVGLGTDPTPAERTWTIRNVPCEQATAQQTAAQATLARHQAKLAVTNEKLRRAKADGNEKLVTKYTQKKKALRKKIRADRAAVQAAATQAQTVC